MHPLCPHSLSYSFTLAFPFPYLLYVFNHPCLPPLSVFSCLSPELNGPFYPFLLLQFIQAHSSLYNLFFFFFKPLNHFLIVSSSLDPSPLFSSILSSYTLIYPFHIVHLLPSIQCYSLLFTSPSHFFSINSYFPSTFECHFLIIPLSFPSFLSSPPTPPLSLLLQPFSPLPLLLCTFSDSTTDAERNKEL